MEHLPVFHVRVLVELTRLWTTQNHIWEEHDVLVGTTLTLTNNSMLGKPIVLTAMLYQDMVNIS